MGAKSMAENSLGARSVLRVPGIYALFQKVLSRKPIWPDLLEEFLEKKGESARVLDIGCGPATFLHGGWLPVNHEDFVGIDPSAEYIAAAKRDFPLANFFQGTVENVSLGNRQFDLVVLSGVLHHLDDSESTAAMDYAVNHLSEGGIVISVDPVFFRGQNRFARMLAKADRGQNVRTVDDLERLWKKNLGKASLQMHITEGYLRVPYNHVVAIVRKSSSGN